MKSPIAKKHPSVTDNRESNDVIILITTKFTSD